MTSSAADSSAGPGRRRPTYEPPTAGRISVHAVSERRLLMDAVFLVLQRRAGIGPDQCVHVEHGPGASATTGPADRPEAGVLVVDLERPGSTISMLAELAGRPGWIRRVGVYERFDASVAELAFDLGITMLIALDGPPTAFAEILLGDRTLGLHTSSGLTRDELERLRHLSTREVEVLTEITAGRTVTDIADELGITAHTVAHHKRSLFAKLGVQSATQAAAMARRAGLSRARAG